MPDHQSCMPKVWTHDQNWALLANPLHLAMRLVEPLYACMDSMISTAAHPKEDVPRRPAGTRPLQYTCSRPSSSASSFCTKQVDDLPKLSACKPWVHGGRISSYYGLISQYHGQLRRALSMYERRWQETLRLSERLQTRSWWVFTAQCDRVAGSLYKGTLQRQLDMTNLLL
jgi:hypothetical protein